MVKIFVRIYGFYTHIAQNISAILYSYFTYFVSMEIFDCNISGILLKNKSFQFFIK